MLCGMGVDGNRYKYLHDVGGTYFNRIGIGNRNQWVFYDVNLLLTSLTVHFFPLQVQLSYT